MKIYCLDDFKVEFEKLLTKKSYKKLEREIIEYFFNKSSNELYSGVNLNNNLKVPYLKKRLGGRGGFRVYFLLLIVKNSLYLMFVHPKAGKYGAPNISKESKVYLYKKINKCIGSNNLYELTLNKEKDKIIFTKL